MNAKQMKEAFAKKKLKSAIVEIDDVGKVMIRELALRDLDSVDSDDTTDARARNVALTIYTEDGSERVFDPDSPEDIEIIKNLGNREINRLASALAAKN
ncbi:hypothetical protein [Allopusillimonas ginsengisoli]|uniref:hypothetical protein n=1 Tax=Allopusillimonas ginsengisoli TaxID=453575 RepID=UPI00101F2722|nr:hypothetical protein [Allopusillimonas ginsengisoli]TEA79837.1 hypothetical protein ERE07_02540 [Allopusillimonas ginsengisoli]